MGLSYVGLIRFDLDMAHWGAFVKMAVDQIPHSAGNFFTGRMTHIFSQMIQLHAFGCGIML